MRKSLFPKFILLYAVIALIAYFAAVTLGRQLILDRLTERRAGQLYSEASSLAADSSSLSFSKEADLDGTYRTLRTVAVSENTTIHILNTSGSIILSTDYPPSSRDRETIEGFNYAAFGPGRYEVSRFYGLYHDERLNVMVPLTRNMSIIGYLAIHEPMTSINAAAESVLEVLLIMVTLILLMTLSILVLFYFSVYRPLGRIRAGAEEITAGHLDHRIRISNEDEIGQVAHSLNEMAADIQKTGEYQRNFISNVSHDFRSPLTSIKGFTEAMTDGTIPPEMHDKYLKIIQSEVERLEKLTRSTLTLESLDRLSDQEAVLDLTDFDINAVIRNTAAVFEGSCRQKKISFAVTLVEGPLYVRADQDKIQQVLYNLIDNAVKFSPEESTIDLETRIRRNHCEVSVKDEGIGIPEENLNRIWDRFYKSDNSRGIDKKGTGLGLSIVREIIKAHDQTITVTSTPDVGTKFVFTLALGQAPDAG